MLNKGLNILFEVSALNLQCEGHDIHRTFTDAKGQAFIRIELRQEVIFVFQT